MSEKIKETQKRLKELGYFASEELSKIVLLFEASGKRDRKNIPALLLEGKSGAGKTFLAETFSKMIGADEKFVQCFSRIGREDFQLDINAEGFIRQDADNLIKSGILLQAIEQSKKGPVVLTIDELDKSRPEVDAFLLDFLENGRLSTGTDVYKKGKHPIYTIITSNGKREIDETLINRSKRVEIPRPKKELFLEILELPEDHYLGWVYEQCPDFSIRQARQYLEDLEVLGTTIDEDALSQYVNLDELEVTSIADIQRLTKTENKDIEIELPDLERCSLLLDSKNEQGWTKLFKDGNKGDFHVHYKDDRRKRLHVDIDTVEQLSKVSEYIKFDLTNSYSGWFEYNLSDEEMESDNIIWAENKNEKDGTRFGVKLDEDKMFRIAMNRGSTFVYLDSSEHTLEQFLGQEKGKNEQEYETDSEYYNDEIEYDD